MFAAPAAAVAIAAVRWRIDFAGNIIGREAIYSAAVGSPAPLAVVSPDQPAVDYWTPVPSPDGRYLAFNAGKKELLARADGSAVRVLSDSFVALPVWSPDSTRIAWLSFGGDGVELHVARADSLGARVVSRRSAGSRVVWSPDGRHVRIGAASPAGVDSPDGRWAVRPSSNGFAVVRRGSTHPVVTRAGHWWTWSPDSLLLAYATAGGIAVLEMRTLRTRLLTGDAGSQLTWSPDGTLLAYVDCCVTATAGVGDVRTVTRTGTVRVVVPGSTAGVVAQLAWARSDPSASYRPAPAELHTTAPVDQLAADGTGVAYAACGAVYLWTPADGSVTGPTRTNCEPHDSLSVYTLALAGRQVAYGLMCCNNIKSWTLSVVVFGQAPQLLVSGGGDLCCTSYAVLAGHGSLIAYAADRTGFPDYLWTVRTPGGPPLISFVQDRYVAVALDVDGDRILVAHDGAVDVVLSENGGTVFHLDVPIGATPDAQLDGADVAVRDGASVDVYAVNGGALLHTWPLPPGSKLQDAARGLLAFTAGDEIFVLRLADGLQNRVAPGTLAAFMDGGLAAANGAGVRLVPDSVLPAN
jgi:WD40-like Beta Propeller Repeat